MAASNVIPSRSQDWMAPWMKVALGQLTRNRSSIRIELSTPTTCKPRDNSARVSGTPVPQPMSRTRAPGARDEASDVTSGRPRRPTAGFTVRRIQIRDEVVLVHLVRTRYRRPRPSGKLCFVIRSAPYATSRHSNSNDIAVHSDAIVKRRSKTTEICMPSAIRRQ